jgi:hypothetical protein
MREATGACLAARPFAGALPLLSRLTHDNVLYHG